MHSKGTDLQQIMSVVTLNIHDGNTRNTDWIKSNHLLSPKKPKALQIVFDRAKAKDKNKIYVQ